MLCYLFYRAKLVPRWMAVWGLVGYATIFLCGSVSEIMGFGLGLAPHDSGRPVGAVHGVWLIAKGFNASAFVPQAPRTTNLAEPLVP